MDQLFSVQFLPVFGACHSQTHRNRHSSRSAFHGTRLDGMANALGAFGIVDENNGYTAFFAIAARGINFTLRYVQNHPAVPQASERIVRGLEAHFLRALLPSCLRRGSL